MSPSWYTLSFKEAGHPELINLHRHIGRFRVKNKDIKVSIVSVFLTTDGICNNAMCIPATGEPVCSSL